MPDRLEDELARLTCPPAERFAGLLGDLNRLLLKEGFTEHQAFDLVHTYLCWILERTDEDEEEE